MGDIRVIEDHVIDLIRKAQVFIYEHATDPDGGYLLIDVMDCLDAAEAAIERKRKAAANDRTN